MHTFISCEVERTYVYRYMYTCTRVCFILYKCEYADKKRRELWLVLMKNFYAFYINNFSMKNIEHKI